MHLVCLAAVWQALVEGSFIAFRFIIYEVLIMPEAKIEMAREIACNLLLAGCSVEFVSVMTGVPVEEVEELPRFDGCRG